MKRKFDKIIPFEEEEDILQKELSHFQFQMTKKFKQVLDTLHKSYMNCQMQKSTDFISIDDVENIMNHGIIMATGKIIVWDEVEIIMSFELPRLSLKQSCLISKKIYDIDIQDYVIKNKEGIKDHLLKSSRTLIDGLKTNNFTVKKEVQKFMKGKYVEPKFGDLMNEFGNKKMQIKKSTTNKLKPRADSKIKNSKTVIKRRKAFPKTIKILEDKLINNKSNKSIMSKYNISQNQIYSSIRALDKNKLDFFPTTQRAYPRKKKFRRSKLPLFQLF